MRMFRPILPLVMMAVLLPGTLISGNVVLSRDVVISWNPVERVPRGEAPPLTLIHFPGSSTRSGYGHLPFTAVSWPAGVSADSVVSVVLAQPVYEPWPEAAGADGIALAGYEPVVIPSIVTRRKVDYVEVAVLPLRISPVTGQPERLVSFSLNVTMSQRSTPKPVPAKSSALSSVLSSGRWYKFSVTSTGIHKLTYEELSTLGIPVGSADPANIRIYGNGGGMLPEANSASRPADLTENPIFVYRAVDGKFGPGDYILFYGESPDTWYYSAGDQRFRHSKNIYTNHTCYFLTFDLGPGKRVVSEPSTTLPANTIVTGFDDYAFLERNDINLIKSGREWFDRELFDITTTRNYSLTFPNIDQAIPMKVTVDVAARSTSGSTAFSVRVQGVEATTITIPPTGTYYLDTYAIGRQGSATILPKSDLIDMNLVYSKPYSNSTGYLNWIEVNATRMLRMAGAQMPFRSLASAGKDKVSEFTLSGTPANTQVWDVTHRYDIRVVGTQQAGDGLKFRLETDSLRQFIAFDGSSFLTPGFVKMIENQDLHSASVPDYIIVSHPSFVPEAERLAAFHNEHSGLTTLVTTTEKIYNEFSSGVQDLSAIRDFVRYLYNRADPGQEPKYLMLFGDASYDFLGRLSVNHNFVPSFQSVESLDPIDSYVTDDFFVLLDPNEGQGSSGELDMGVGRFGVMTPEEAKSAVDKVLHYCSNTDAVKNDWRNVVCFVGDDQDEGGNIFVIDSENLGALIESGHPEYNIDKIYLDAYNQVSTPGGKRYPEVNEAINKRVEKGALIVNYVGHGGEVGWSHERVLEVADIKGWRNFNNLPVFMTATCEFSRFDDPERISAGEWVFLNQTGGGIALFTTTRATFAGSNYVLSYNFYQNAFNQTQDGYHRMGDLIMLSKVGAGSNANARKFVLLGDPALMMNYPNLEVVTTSIEQGDPPAVTDTLKALATITIRGEVRDAQGDRATDFTGTVFPTVFDKASEIWTKGNDGGSPVRFYLRKNPVYKGQAAVTNGAFEFSFIVPKDIAYKYGAGKISYYARSSSTDASGYDDRVVVGGYDDQAIPDEQGPDIALYMNTRDFVSGGITNSSPTLLADIHDESGINTVGNGIGHDLTAVLDNKTNEPMILNDYYVTDLNTFTSGSVSYPLSALPEGSHRLVVKAWDVYNNSSESGIDFLVINANEFAYERLYNYPNPMRDHTTFAFETNQVNQELAIEIQIYTIYGEMIKRFNRTLYASGYRLEPITWNGFTDAGRKVSAGTYVYRVLVTIPDGTTHSQTSKLVVIP